MHYRPEIDGLRTVAVLPVILFHAGVTVFSGGYVGVDIFFVISGFLISGILLRELDAERFSLLNFYERRARRILPALFFVLASTSVIAGFVMLPYELASFGKGLIAVMLFVSNVLFWRESGYFAPQSEENPLLHTWSLSVEEQFYIFFPIGLFLLWSMSRRAVAPALIVLALVSFVLAEYLSARMPSANFYLLPTRAWELLAGSLAALYVFRFGTVKNGPACHCLTGSGIIAILISILIFDASTRFPSFWTALPVLGTVAILLAGNPKTLVYKILSSKPFVALGLISYSAYLWHQPLFAFARLTDDQGHPHMKTMLALALLSLALAWFSWRFIERPFRQKKNISGRSILVMSTTGMLAFSMVGGFLVLNNGAPNRYLEPYRSWVAKGNFEYSDYVTTRYDKFRNQPLVDGARNLTIVGDSYSQDLFNMLVENGALEAYNVSTIYVPARCQIVFGLPFDAYADHISSRNHSLCKRSRLDVADAERLRSSDAIVFAANWKAWSAKLFAKSVAKLELDAESQVLVLGSKNFERRRRAFLEIDLSDFSKARAPVLAQNLETDRILNDAADHYSFVSFNDLLCNDGCPLLTPDGAMISYDGGHLTQEGAQFLGAKLIGSPDFQAFFAH